MRRILSAILALAALGVPIAGTAADVAQVEVTVTYRERIALPPDAELDVQLLDVSRADAPARRIAAQRFALASVPMTVALPYDPAAVKDGASHALIAEIWSGDQRMFLTADRHDPFAGDTEARLDIVLTMAEPDDAAPAVPRTVAGVQWAVTEVLGEAWGNDDPATLIVDGDMRFSIFGGCNRYVGQMVRLDDEIRFPRNFAGTLMACPDDVEALERGLLAALSRASGFVRYGAGLVLTDAGGNAIAHFVAQPE